MRSTFTSLFAPLVLVLARSALADDVKLQSVRFDYKGCDAGQQAKIEDGWQEALKIANIPYYNAPKWEEMPENHFLGFSGLNGDHRDNIKKVLQNAATFTKASFFNPHPWWIEIHCDDLLKDAVSGKGACSTKKFPKKTAAYTLNDPNAFSKYPIIGFCPDWFNKLDTCKSRIDKYGKSKRLDFKLDLQNYQCRGYATLHEIFHLNWENNVGKQGAITDKAMPIRREYDNQVVRVPVYGPQYTKILSGYNNPDVGKFVSQNADNYAQYSLAKWVQKQIGTYPHDPPRGTEPVVGDPTDVKIKFKIDDGQLTLVKGASLSDDPGADPENLHATVTNDDTYETFCDAINNDGCVDGDDSVVTITELVPAPTNTDDITMPTDGPELKESLFGNPTTPTPTPSPTPTGKPCEGNQVQGDCVQGHFPQLPDNSGAQEPICNKFGGDVKRIDGKKAAQAAADYCQELKDAKYVLKKDGPHPNPKLVEGAAEDGGDLAVSVLYFAESCDQGGKTTELDFGAMSSTDCQNNFYGILEQFCSQDESWGDGHWNPDYPFEGGVYAANCGMFGMMGQPGRN